MNKKIIISLILGIIFIGILALMLNSFQKPIVQSNKIQVAASFYPLHFFAQQIGGDKADVINITPAGAEPHDYEPTAQQMTQIENSKLLILNGGGLEVWGDNIKQNLNSENTVIVITGQGLINQKIVEEGENITDPHIWLNPLKVREMADKIAQGFIQIDPANKDYYQSNANEVKAKLGNLDEEFKQGLNSCLEKNIITSHAAFGYLATAYALNQVPISGLSPDEEPSPQQLADVAEFAKANNIKYIFFESLISPRLSETIATEVGAKTLVLNPIEGLTDKEISQGKDYFTEMKNNLANLKIALQCK